MGRNLILNDKEQTLQNMASGIYFLWSEGGGHISNSFTADITEIHLPRNC